MPEIKIMLFPHYRNNIMQNLEKLRYNKGFVLIAGAFDVNKNQLIVFNMICEKLTLHNKKNIPNNPQGIFVGDYWFSSKYYFF